MDNLKEQLTSNSTLWEQLAESEKREAILKQELAQSQNEIATYGKNFQVLMDDIKKERHKNARLLADNKLKF